MFEKNCSSLPGFLKSGLFLGLLEIRSSPLNSDHEDLGSLHCIVSDTPFVLQALSVL